MDIPMIRMLPREAKRVIGDFRRSAGAELDQATRRAVRVYEALAAGTPVLTLSEVFRTVPVDAKGRPRLAVWRAHESQVKCDSWNDHVTFRAAVWSPRGEMRVAMPAFSERQDGYAPVPRVPTRIAGKHANDPRWLTRHWILWEVEAWSDTQHGTRVDRDPFLLRRLVGDVFAVIDHWDLTAVEQAVLTAIAN